MDKTIVLNIIMFLVKNYNDWITEVLKKLNRKTADIRFCEHFRRDKNFNVKDIDNIVFTIKYGKAEYKKSSEYGKKICFKNYFKDGETYFVVVVFKRDYILVITFTKKRGKY